ncbi:MULTISPECIES: DEAD/DEAH box helicase family protein [Exiguobacterium]|uniref:DEAD/DEAH box helicase family protein n=1 Tax=Exiguobacterium TaxID=33986 RepID=UPI001BE86E4C|nr:MULTISPECIES: DEAD/DEAH box helicase family protein [Exiguobacterium]MCT4777186.1 DEAD/DEAH box helicase family protein [Exiguobacterium aquaticum]MCT4787906.1 DEAD/DEAH box helicase family protein [Exiguobacterium mexicanum]
MKTICRKKTKITVVNSIMGSGKTSWAIQHMDEASSSNRFIYITPFKSEIERVIGSLSRDFVQPENTKDGTKLESLKKLITEGKDIVSTHALFQRMDKELITLIQLQGYTLILDEVMDVLEPVKLSSDDLKVLLSAKNKRGESIITVNENGFVRWNDETYSEGNFTNIRNVAKAGNLMLFNNVAMYWLFPIEAFKGFDEVFIMTYMFSGQIQKYYYDLFNLTYEYRSVSNLNGKYTLVDYVELQTEDRTHLKDLIKIHYSKSSDKIDLNRMGEGRYALSKSNLKDLTRRNTTRKILKNNAYNFYRNKVQVKSDQVMWTTFKEFRTKVSPIGLKKEFVSVNARATNDYADKSVCIYIANRYMNPVTKQFFASKGITVDEDLFALSELLQWLFRSRVRKGEPIDVYIPSERMRSLLEGYLEGSNENPLLFKLSKEG